MIIFMMFRRLNDGELGFSTAAVLAAALDKMEVHRSES